MRWHTGHLLTLLLLPLLGGLVGCTSTGSQRPGAPPMVGAIERGEASWYGRKFHGRRTASGERYDMHALTAAHRTLPFGTLLEVRNLDNGELVRVRVNDRGPFARGRILDLSYGAAKVIGMVGPGIARIELRVVGAGPANIERGNDRFSVQVGAFADPERAAALCQELRTTNPEAEVRADGIWHRVQLGLFHTRSLAEDLRDEMVALGHPALVVVVPNEP